MKYLRTIALLILTAVLLVGAAHASEFTIRSMEYSTSNSTTPTLIRVLDGAGNHHSIQDPVLIGQIMRGQTLNWEALSDGSLRLMEFSSGNATTPSLVGVLDNSNNFHRVTNSTQIAQLIREHVWTWPMLTGESGTASDADTLDGHHWSEIQTPAPTVTPAPTPENTIRVAKSGGDYTTIAAALTAAASIGDCSIIVYPGVYAEQNLEVPNGVSLIGVNRASCVIRYTSTNYNGSSAPTSALLAVPYSSEIANLTIDNTRSSYPSVALVAGWGWAAGETTGRTIRIRNCSITGNDVDALYTLGANDIEMDGVDVNCDGDSWSVIVPSGAIHRFRNGSIQGNTYGSYKPAIWIAGQGTVTVENSWLSCYGNSATTGCIRGGDVGTGTSASLRFHKCSFRYYSTGLPWYVWSDGGSGGTWAVYLYDCDFAGMGGSNYGTVTYGTMTAPVAQLVPSSAPSSPTAGWTYYDSGENKVKVWNGSTWKTVSFE